MRVELYGLHVFGYHGVEEEEQRLGQLFLYDIELEVGERGVSDRIEDAVDYREVALAVRRVSERRFDLLEALATAVADELMTLFELEWLKVRVRKPQVKPAGLTVEYGAVTVERPSP
jgi:dihydroneopterin aldolase